MKIICFPFYHELLQTMHRKDLNIKNKVYINTKSYIRDHSLFMTGGGLAKKGGRS
jgi:hypothetical protein